MRKGNSTKNEKCINNINTNLVQTLSTIPHDESVTRVNKSAVTLKNLFLDSPASTFGHVTVNTRKN